MQAKEKSKRNEGRRRGDGEKYIRKGLGIERGETYESKSKDGREKEKEEGGR